MTDVTTRVRAIATLLAGAEDMQDVVLVLREAADELDGRKGLMTEEQIKHMVDRFLGWRLPENFSPDAGISFKAAFNEYSAYKGKHEPTGTNLFEAAQAEAMVRYMLEGMPDPEQPQAPRKTILEKLADNRRRPVPDESLGRAAPAHPAVITGEQLGRAANLAFSVLNNFPVLLGRVTIYQVNVGLRTALQSLGLSVEQECG